MKTESEIKAELQTLKNMLNNDNSEQDKLELQFKIVALEWVLGYQSDIFN